MEKRKGAEKAIEITASSGNVFRDLGISDAEELQTKVKIAVALNKILGRFHNWTQEQIAQRIGTEQPKVSALQRYNLDGFSVERLMGFLTALDYDIDINIRPRSAAAKKSHPGRIKVTVRAA